ncbi:EAL domain-containing response regulator [Oceanimonas pelagia]|uniref:EAL domain-containing response regulator n=1 Tax=Oceanimonas pelagia TaxID=3028314 RepID=A0AA50KN74_9GAMM|nr:EAL domain-containing response regulator [Oceanimonas pelagia]WMC11266.1 EAL domain-containing response regulator [Oceanimonas pelagia]
MDILVVDDDVVSLKLLIHHLKKLGFSNVRGVESATDALRLIKDENHVPDLVFLDINMPGMDGLALIRELENMQFNGDLVLVSGQDKKILHSSIELSRACKVNLVGHIEKPATQSSLAELFERLDDKGIQAGRHEWQPAGRELAAAIEQRELVNHYQPKICLASGAVAGLEALVRWQYPGLGLMGPDRFIGAAEHYGHIDALTHLVVENALRDCRACLQAEEPLSVSINISMLSLSSPEVMTGLYHLVLEHGVSPRRITFEVTESHVLNDRRQPLEILTRLKMLGFGLSIDDYGTGYSSLRQLRDYPFDELKLDRSFIDGISESVSKRNIYNSTVAMAKDLGMTVVAEGVENIDDLNLLKSTGCNFAQGFLLARPMPIETVLEWLPRNEHPVIAVKI